MRSARFAPIRLFPFAPVVVAAACSASSEPVNVSLAPSISMPKGLLDNAEVVTVTVYDVREDTVCDEITGRSTGVSDETKVAAGNLGTEGCAPNVRFCGNLDILRSNKPRLFSAIAYGAGNAQLAQGCTIAVANQVTIPVQIRMKRYVPPSFCGDVEVPYLVQCSQPGGPEDLVCDENCISKEIWLSNGSKIPGFTEDGEAGDKSRPSFVWPSGGDFVAVWGDRTPKPFTQIAMRILAPDLSLPKPDQVGIEPARNSIFIPNDPQGGFPPEKEPNAQFAPQAVLVGSKYYVVFQGNSEGTIDVAMRSMNLHLIADQPKASPLIVNENQSGVQARPAIAVGPQGLIYIAWQSAESVGPGTIQGRIYDPVNETFRPQIDISSGGRNQNVAVAGGSQGWIVVWEDADSGTIKMRMIDATGNPKGEDRFVSDQTHKDLQLNPAVAVADDGRFAVAWADDGAAGGSDIFVQRFDKDGNMVANDQQFPVNDIFKEGAQVQPAIAAGPGFFIVAWADVNSQQIRGRFLGTAEGFVPNTVDGQTSEFQVSLAKDHPRANPTIAVGGIGPSIAIGWEDLIPKSEGAQPGIYVRRFPIPK